MTREPALQPLGNPSDRVRRTVKYICVAVALAGLVALTAYQVRVQQAGQKRSAMGRELQAFAGEAPSAMLDVGRRRLPSTLADLCGEVQSFIGQHREPSDRRSSVYRGVLRGVDLWERPLVYELSADGRVARLRSVGPNGRDERGNGDDVEVMIRME